jgi:hypothetical protein
MRPSAEGNGDDVGGIDGTDHCANVTRPPVCGIRPARGTAMSGERERALRNVVKFEGHPRGEESALEVDRLELWWYVRRRIAWAGATQRDPETFRVDVLRFDVPGCDPWIVGFFDADQ